MKMYLVKYNGGSYEDYYEKNIFVTSKLSTAKRYRSRFNRILKKWKKHYSQYEERNVPFNLIWIADEHVKHFHRWDQLRNVFGCYIEEIEVR